MDRVFFDAVLEPNRPLHAKGRVMVLGFVALLSVIAAVAFTIHGAWPVTPFFGADVALLALAMQISVRSSRRRERLTLTSRRLLIERISPNGASRREELDPYWLRVEHEDPELVGCELALVARGRRWIVGSFLGAEERASLADALRGALRQARLATPQA